jgi:5-oxoprolinase (ATP-hydrolysing) subunit A
VASMEAGASGRQRIDLNADVGESFGPWRMGDDERLIPLVSSVNIACGAHAGDPLTIARTVRLAVAHGAAIGAHPGYPDLAGFGRRDLDMPPDELEASLIVQVGAVQAIARSEGAKVRHVKPHGALYNRAARDEELAATVAGAIARLDRDLVLVGLAGSALLAAGRAAALAVLAEGFADRAYEADGSLRDRRTAGAILAPAAAAAQAVSIARDRCVVAVDGTRVAVEADTLCVHGDGAQAVETAMAVRTALEAADIVVRSR